MTTKKIILPKVDPKKKPIAKKKKKKSNAGAPPKMTEATLKILNDAFLIGASDEQACFKAEISPQTLYNYQHKHPKYIEHKKALKADLRFRARINISKDVDSGNVDTSKYVLDRTDPDFKPKNKLEIEGVLSQEEMDAQAKLTAKYLDDINKGKK